MDKNGLRPIALEILATDNSEVVKLAGLWRRFQNWWRGFRSSEYKEKVDQLRSENQEAVSLSKEIEKQLKEMNSAIKDGDIAAYDASARESKRLMLELTKLVGKTDAEVRAFTRQMYREMKSDQSLNLLKPPGNDVEWEKRYENVPLRSFKWYRDLPDKLHISEGALKGLIRETKNALVNAKVPNVEDFFSRKNLPEFLEALKNAALGGNLVWAEHREPAPENKGELANKARKGDSVITVHTDEFILPNNGPRIALEVNLNDVGRSHQGVRSQSPLSLRSTGRIWIKKGPLEPIKPIQQSEKTPDEKLKDLSEEEEKRLQEAMEEEERRIGEAEGLEAQRLETSYNPKLIKQARVNPDASKNLSPEFWEKFVAMAGRLNAKPEDLAKVIMSESAFDPGAINEQGGRAVAKGLSQFTLVTLPAIGMSREQWNTMEAMSAEEQLPYIEKYFRNASRIGGISKWEDATQLYVANFAPAFLNKPNAPFYEKGSVAYAMNKGLDRDNKGYISAKDLGVSVSRPLPNHISQAIQDASGSTKIDSSDEIESLTAQLLSSYGTLTHLVKDTLIKKFLPQSDFLVLVKSDSIINSLEFARIASDALRKTIDARISICAGDEEVEMQCYALGRSKTVSGAAQAICDVISNEMNRKLGLSLRAMVVPEMVSKYAEVETENMVRNYRTFHLERISNG